MSSKKNKTGAKNPTRKQQAERIKQAEARAPRQGGRRGQGARTKKIFTVVVWRHPRARPGHPPSLWRLTVLSP